MKRLTLWFMVAAMALMSAGSLAFAQTPPLRPAVTYNVKMPSTGIATEFELVHLIQDFAPGASSPVHTHGGQGLALVLEGEITQRMEGQPDKVYKPGETFLETPGVYFAVANAGSVPARLSVQFLLPKGETLTTPQQPSGTPTTAPPPGPRVTYNVRMASPAIPGEFELTHLIQDFAPGASTPVHTHGGHGLALVLDGELTQRMEGQPDKVYKAGDMFMETPEVYFAVVNARRAPARLSVGFLLPKGAALTTVQQVATATAVAQPPAPPAPVVEETVIPISQPVGMPSTGSGGTDVLLSMVAIALTCLAVGALSRSHYVKQR